MATPKFRLYPKGSDDSGVTAGGEIEIVFDYKSHWEEVGRLTCLDGTWSFVKAGEEVGTIIKAPVVRDDILLWPSESGLSFFTTLMEPFRSLIKREDAHRLFKVEILQVRFPEVDGVAYTRGKGVFLRVMGENIGLSVVFNPRMIERSITVEILKKLIHDPEALKAMVAKMKGR